MDESWKYAVIESSDQVLRRRLAAEDATVLRTKHSNEVKVFSIAYNRNEEEIKYHDTYEDDCGYIDFYDVFRKRHIYVTTKSVGTYVCSICISILCVTCMRIDNTM